MMSVKERILSIRLIQKMEKYPQYINEEEIKMNKIREPGKKSSSKQSDSI